MQEIISQEFKLDENIIYLNHAAVAPWPQRTKQAVRQFAEENARQGSVRYLDWIERETGLRKLLAQLINAPDAEDIALLKNTSEGLSIIAYGLDWQPGDNVVISDQEFPSNRIVWESLAGQGVEIRQVDLLHGASPEDALIAATDKQTRLLSVSSVQYASGLRLDLEQLGEYCHTQDILFCIDAIQSIGALQFDVQRYHADFVVADGHKWMLGPEGLALFYVRAAIREQLKLYQYGWHMIEHPGDFDTHEWEIAHSARRFECGSPNMLGIHALYASISLLLEVGMARVEQAVLERSALLFELLAAAAQLEAISQNVPGRYAGIVTWRHRCIDHQELFRYLQSQHIQCAPRGGGIRYSAHFYTPLEKIVEAIELANQASV